MTRPDDSPSRFEDRYQSGNVPWDHKLPDSNLTALVNDGTIKPCRVLDVGCGNGDNSIWLAQHQFQVTGCDVSKTALAEAARRADAAGVSCNFHELDFLAHEVDGAPFELVVDRGCYHTFAAPGDRVRFVERVRDILLPGGLWLSMVGSNDGPVREVGPPRFPASDLVVKAEPFFELLSLRAGHFGSDQVEPPEAWIALLRRRTQSSNR